MKKYCTDEVTGILEKIPIVNNKARKKIVILFIQAIIKTRKVQFCEIAPYFYVETNQKLKKIRYTIRLL